ncbi:penicillin-binding protein 1C [Thorsellia kenyensis]|uniref:peptidoglycan glycosyltransferase n=1 Tax=Thorsellia kenyensis TaxID=1549888 RepID=A0ABV6C7P2_9GAMM
MRKKIQKILVNLGTILLLLSVVILMWRIWPHPPLKSYFTDSHFSTVFVDKEGELMRITTGKDERYRLWTPLDEIPESLQDAVILHEDRYFYQHIGVNPYSLFRGAIRSFILKQRLQGGSTITMQLARMRWQLNTRSILGKSIQVLRALQLELSYSKRDILEAYLNYAPYGRNIESVGAASLIYFNKRPNDLTIPEVMTLAVLPQSPTLRLQDKSGLAGKKLLDARNRLFSRWQIEHPESDQVKDLFSLPLYLRQPENLPFLAPHFVDQLILKKQRDVSTEYIKSRYIETTIDMTLQIALERQIDAYIRRHKAQGIENAAAILVDYRDMSVSALVGSADYFNKSIQGQVNGTFAKRSPGSTLKPFIYALALEQGILHPATILKDVPTQFGAYSPENFDRRFLGPISATQALNFSRNIPAVNVASKLVNPNLYQFLQDNGVENLANEKHYGLALVLGGGEITMQELAQLYSMLANKGKFKRLNFLVNSKNSNSSIVAENSPSLPLNEKNIDKNSLSEASTYITLNMLGQHKRPTDTLAQAPTKIPVYWKTGTSWGFRDAWTAGIFGPYVLIVWEGNFSGKGNNAFIGVEAAAPLFFNIIDTINAEIPDLPATMGNVPSSVKKVDICLTSGQLPTRWCQHVGKTLFIPGISPIKADTIYRPIVLNKMTGKVSCEPFDPETSKIEVFEFWPSDLANAFAQAGVAKKPPPTTKDCSIKDAGLMTGMAPQITSPQKNITYTFRLNVDKNTQTQYEQALSLSATSDAANRTLYWFVDGSYLGSTLSTQSLNWLPNKSGSFQLRVVDDFGLADTRRIKVNIVSVKQ